MICLGIALSGIVETGSEGTGIAGVGSITLTSIMNLPRCSSNITPPMPNVKRVRKSRKISKYSI
jgi:hypothetical protein